MNNIFDRFSLIILYACLITSCEYPLDLQKLGDRNVIKVICKAVPGDTTILDVDVLVPLSDYERIPEKISPENIMLTVDGKEVAVSVAAEDDPRLKPGTFYVVEDFPYGSEICLKAESEGAASVEARTRVPLSLEGFRLDMELTDMVSSQLYGEQVRNIVKARLEIPEVAEGTKVGIRYVKRTKVDSCGVIIYEREYSEPVYDVSRFSSDGNLVSNSDFLYLQRMGSSPDYVWRGTDDYEFIFYHPVDSVTEWTDEEGNAIVWTTATSFYFSVYVFSEEYYRYHSRSTNEFFNLGMASPSYTYTNVKGGAGYLGAYVGIETPLMNESIFADTDKVSVGRR